MTKIIKLALLQKERLGINLNNLAIYFSKAFNGLDIEWAIVERDQGEIDGKIV